MEGGERALVVDILAISIYAVGLLYSLIEAFDETIMEHQLFT